MNKTIPMLVAMLAIVALASGCAQRSWTGGDTGAVLGGVVGGAAGHQIGGGSGKTLATVAGAIAGSVLGRRLGRNMSGTDRNRFGSTLAANGVGNTSHWTNNNTRDSYQVTPTSDNYTRNNQTCRKFRMRANVEGRKDHVNGTACRQPDGTWVVQ